MWLANSEQTRSLTLQSAEASKQQASEDTRRERFASPCTVAFRSPPASTLLTPQRGLPCAQTWPEYPSYLLKVFCCVTDALQMHIFDLHAPDHGGPDQSADGEHGKMPTDPSAFKVCFIMNEKLLLYSGGAGALLSYTLYQTG